MKYKWLEELVKEGSVRADAAETIYSDCRNLAKTANMEQLKKLWTEISPMIQGLGGLAITASSLAELPETIDKMMMSQRDVSSMDKTKELISNTPELASNLPKAEARFREIVQYAPSVAANPEMAMRIIKKTLHSGLTDRDIENLQTMQMTANAGIGGSYSRQANYGQFLTDKMNARMEKVSSVGAIRPEILGHIAFDVNSLLEVGIEKNAGIGDFISKAFKGRMGPFLAMPLIAGAAQLGVGAVAGVGNMAKEKVRQNNFKDQLEKSFATAVSESDVDRELLKQNPSDARKAFETLVHFAPSIAVQPQAARSFMQKMLAYEDQALQPSDIKDLVSIEKDFRSAAGAKSPFFDAFNATGKLLGLGSTISGTTSSVVKPYLQAHEEATRHDISSQMHGEGMV